MARLFELRATPTDVVLRALAIAFVVYNHTHQFDAGPMTLEGGMTFLLMLTGLNFARFAISEGDAARIRRSIVEMARQVFVPSFVLVVLSFAVYRQFDLLEFLFVRNWRDPRKIAAFYDWYPMMLVQMLAGFYLLMSIPAVSRAVVRHPVRSLLWLFAAGLALRALGPLVWDTAPLRHRLPHTMLWNFALGGVVYFLAIHEPTSTRWGRIVAVACVLAGAAVGYTPDKLPFWWLIVSGTMLVTIRHIRLPRFLARATMLLSAATFAIFLTHEIWFKIISRINELWAGPEAIVNAEVLFALALVCGTLGWAAFRAFVQAYSNLTRPFSATPSPRSQEERTRRNQSFERSA